MTPSLEKMLLQLAVLMVGLVPLAASVLSLLQGPAFLAGGAAVPIDLDSHFRYLSGIFFTIWLLFMTCVPRIERKGHRFRLLGLLVIGGGLGRVFSLAAAGVPSSGQIGGLVIELVVVPLLLLWQARIARRIR